MSFVSENLIGILVACIILLIFYKLKKTLGYFSDKGWPYISPTLKDIYNTVGVNIFNDQPHDVYQRARTLKSSYVGFFGPYLKPSVLVLDPSLAESILIKDFSFFQDHGFDIDFDKNPLAGHLFNMKGDQWRTLRHKLVPTFTSGKLRGMVPIMEECADDLINDIKQDPSLKKDTNLKELFKRYSLSVIASTAFGIDPQSIKDPNCQFRKVLQETVAPKLSSQIKFGLAFLFPKIFKLLNLKLFSKEAEDFIFSLTKQSFEMRKSGMKRNDFMQLLFELKEKGSVELDVKDLEQDEKDTIAAIQSESTSTKLEFTDQLLAAQAFVFLAGGFENTAYLVTITMYLLSKHSEIQSRVREEVKHQKAKHGGLDYQSLRDMKLLGACIDEALRLHTPIINIPRGCNKTYTLNDGNKLEKGSTLLLPVKSFHLDSRYWTDPEEFKPDRFLNGETIIPGAYIPFGDGPRICIAQRMALIIAKLLLAKLVLNFELLPSPKTKEPIELKILFGADNEGGFWGSFKELNN